MQWYCKDKLFLRIKLSIIYHNGDGSMLRKQWKMFVFYLFVVGMVLYSPCSVMAENWYWISLSDTVSTFVDTDSIQGFSATMKNVYADGHADVFVVKFLPMNDDSLRYEINQFIKYDTDGNLISDSGTHAANHTNLVSAGSDMEKVYYLLPASNS